MQFALCAFAHCCNRNDALIAQACHSCADRTNSGSKWFTYLNTPVGFDLTRVSTPAQKDERARKRARDEDSEAIERQMSALQVALATSKQEVRSALPVNFLANQHCYSIASMLFLPVSLSLVHIPAAIVGRGPYDRAT